MKFINKKKIVFVGYPGIGKTTAAKEDVQIIDLESSNFNKSNYGWFKDYVNVVEQLTDAGYFVLTSAHPSVISELYLRGKFEIVFYYPSFETKDFMVRRLENRWIKSRADKDWRAYDYVKGNFEKSISDIEQYSGITLRPLTEVDLQQSFYTTLLGYIKLSGCDVNGKIYIKNDKDEFVELGECVVETGTRWRIK